MADVIKYRFRCRRRTAAEWVSVNEILLAQEIGLEEDTGLGKIGDGSTAWNDLLYTIVGQVDLSDLATGKCLIWNATSKTWSAGIAGGRVDTVVAGTNMDVDSTDPINPVVSSLLGAVTLKGRVTDYDDLPTSGNAAGDAYVVDATSSIYVWDGSAWPDEDKGLSFSSKSLESLTPTLLNAWSTSEGSGIIALRTSEGYVQIQGSVVNGTTTLPVLTLPPAWAPAYDLIFPSNGSADITVKANGDVYVSANNTNTQLGNAGFLCAAFVPPVLVSRSFFLTDGTATTRTFTFAYGEAPYTLTLGTLPDGVTFDGTDTLTYDGSSSSTVTGIDYKLTDVNGRSTTGTIDITISELTSNKAYRLKITANNGSSQYVTVCEWAAYASTDGSGDNLLVAGTAASNGDANSLNAASYAFDGQTSTKWTSSGVPTGAAPKYLAYLLDNPVLIQSVALTGCISGQETYALKSAVVQSSNDATNATNGTWVDEWTLPDQTGWTAGETRIIARE